MPRCCGRKDSHDASLFPPIEQHFVCRRAVQGRIREPHQSQSAGVPCCPDRRAASGRRRFVDPTTCERDYSAAELEFMQAMQEYKQTSGRKFPTWSEVLEVLQGIGYRKHA